MNASPHRHIRAPIQRGPVQSVTAASAGAHDRRQEHPRALRERVVPDLLLAGPLAGVLWRVGLLAGHAEAPCSGEQRGRDAGWTAYQASVARGDRRERGQVVVGANILPLRNVVAGASGLAGASDVGCGGPSRGG